MIFDIIDTNFQKWETITNYTTLIYRRKDHADSFFSITVHIYNCSLDI